MRNSCRALFLILFSWTLVFAQASKKDIWADENFDGLEFRSIGPALMSGRIADIAIHPEDESIWYIAVGSGGVWKTVNAGVTWTPIFDDQGSYSIGCVTIDPSNPHIVWVGTGEDQGGRHFGYGDGVYRSDDGGKTWANMGLKDSEHVSKIVIHPKLMTFMCTEFDMNEHSTNVFKDIINSLGAFVQNVMLASPANDPNNEAGGSSTGGGNQR